MKKSLLIMMVLIMSYTSVTQAAISNLVIPVSYFVDHVKQLTLIKNNLIKYRQTSLIGISGMGKTQLARMYAYENKNNYELIWFIDCNLDINEEFLKLAKSINEKAKTNLISEDIRSAKKEVLSYLSSKDKWLLVFDNLKIKENHKVQEFIDWEHNGYVIFASQDSELLPNVVKMTAFDKDDVITLANNILEKDDPKLAEFLVQEFAGYPILIVQGVQLLNQVPGLNQEEYKKRLRDSADKIKLNITLAMKELKPNTKKLLNKIALINNQSFSKELLKVITDNKNAIDDDIYQLSKFALISNTDPNEINPVFEMHDVVANKIMELNGNKNNRAFLEDVITKLVNYIPKDVVKGRVFRNSRTIQENFEIIEKNSINYNITIYKLMELNTQLIIQYMNSYDYYNVEKKIDWFNKNDQQGNFKLLLMNNDEKAMYAAYLELIGIYYLLGNVNYNTAIEYYTKAKEIFHKVKGYEAYKCNVVYFLAKAYISLGRIQEAEENIQVVENMFNKELVNSPDIVNLYYAKTSLLFMQGKYKEALEQVNNTIKKHIEGGVQANDIYLVGPYMSRSEILNSLGEYNEAYEQSKQLYDMHKSVKKEDHEVFARIFTQMSRAELGLGNATKALEHAQKAITIFINDPNRPNKNLTTSPDIDLAKAFVAEGDALAALGQNEKAVQSYLTAEMLYGNNYKDNMKNVDGVSRMYLAAAKASCHLAEKAWYIKFHDQHISKFGSDHPRSIEILKMDSICYPESQR